MLLLANHEAAQPERQPAHRPTERRYAVNAREQEHPEHGDDDVECSEGEEAVNWREQQRRHDRRRIQGADLALGEQREAAEDVGRPERKFARPDRGVQRARRPE